MSALARHGAQVTRRRAPQRVRAAGRSRRADAGAVTEMARALLRDAREAGSAEAWCHRSATTRAVRRELAGAPQRLSSRQLAAPPA